MYERCYIGYNYLISMKKILFRKLLIDCFVFFLICLVSLSVIIWVFQAVNYLDLMIEDGKDHLTYLTFTILNFPKIFTKILPFSIFFGFLFIISKYELNNELMIFWNFGVNKINLINFFLIFSIFILMAHIVLTAIIVPVTQKQARTLIKNSNVNILNSFIKEKKFIDTVKGLTIYVESKDSDGILKNIYLKKQSDSQNFQITYSKTGKFENINNSNNLLLYNGETINFFGDNITNFSFSKSNFNLENLETNSITHSKTQELSTVDLINCTKYFFNIDEKLINDQLIKIDNCTKANLINIYKELYKRFIIPIYTPVLIMISLMLIIYSKENINYIKYRNILFVLGLGIIIFSETTLRFVGENLIINLNLIFMPLLILMLFYFIYFYQFTFRKMKL